MQQSAKIINLDSKNRQDDQETLVPLSIHVTKTVEYYFSQLNGHDTCGLHNMVISEVEKPLIEAALNYCSYNQSKTSKILGISRSTLRKKIELYNLS